MTNTLDRTRLHVHIRGLIRRDMPQVLAIEHASDSGLPEWDEDKLLFHIRQRHCIGLVAEHGEQVVGFMVYEFHKSHIAVLNLAVAPSHRRRGVGRSMAEKLIGKLSPERRTEVRMTVIDSNLDAHLFLKACGFEATEVLRGEFDGEDGYSMAYRIAIDPCTGP